MELQRRPLEFDPGHGGSKSTIGDHHQIFVLLIKLPYTSAEVCLIWSTEASAFAVRGHTLLHRPCNLVDQA